MLVNMKLKDGVLLQIGSYMDTVEKFDYYGNTVLPVQNIIFIFDNGYKYSYYDIDGDSGTFTHIVSFFYGIDFSDRTISEFCDEFGEYVGVDCLVTKIRKGETL